jgi:hypothetical protein
MPGDVPMTVAEALENAKGMTFEKFWTGMQELGKKQAQTQAHLDEIGQYIQEMSKRVDRVTANVGGLNRSMGELIESLMTSRMWEKFDRYGHHLVRAYPRVPLYNERNEAMSDIDILLSNTNECMAVEVKREADKDDIDHHLKRLMLVEKYPPAEVKGKKIYAAMAGAVVPPDVRNYAFEKGMYVLEMNGEYVSLFEPPKEFTAKIW